MATKEARWMGYKRSWSLSGRSAEVKVPFRHTADLRRLRVGGAAGYDRLLSRGPGGLEGLVQGALDALLDRGHRLPLDLGYLTHNQELSPFQHALLPERERLL